MSVFNKAYFRFVHGLGIACLGMVVHASVVFAAKATKIKAPTEPTAMSGLNAEEIPLSKIKLPPGFKIELFADKIEGARSMALGSDGTLFIGSRDVDKVYALSQGKLQVIAEKLNSPNGVAFRDGALYVAEINRILRFDNIEKNLSKPAAKVVLDTLPTDKHHGWKFIAFGPDGKLYVPVGAPCNVCEGKDPRYASILRMNADGSAQEVFAKGVRNTVGFDWHPRTKELWFTENGRDMLGDDTPPDELNRAPKSGMDFGFPYCHAGRISDPKFGEKKKCEETTKPEQELGPHVAALGMRFYTGSMFPDEYIGRVFIAEHGSWNRSTPLGYRLMTVKAPMGTSESYEIFAEGWLQGREAWGRPVDVLVTPSGAMLVSDDLGGRIYKISFTAKRE
jgi:glucose/arabinose dehydrogenase